MKSESLFDLLLFRCLFMVENIVQMHRLKITLKVFYDKYAECLRIFDISKLVTVALSYVYRLKWKKTKNKQKKGMKNYCHAIRETWNVNRKVKSAKIYRFVADNVQRTHLGNGVFWTKGIVCMCYMRCAVPFESLCRYFSLKTNESEWNTNINMKTNDNKWQR